jgi:hypothetical protein
MTAPQLDVPVALLIFNRPDTTAQVWKKIAAARPRHLLVVADGPRPDRAGEAGACSTARAVTERVDWPCEVRRTYADRNMGCAERVASGLGWVFEQVEEAIILEDDCVPDPSFFPFCREVLLRYRHDDRVAAVSGDNFLGGGPRTGSSYYFSLVCHVWGWATWRRSWRHFDPDMRRWPELRARGWLRELWPDPAMARYWTDIFDRAHRREIDTWDYAWNFSCWREGAVTATPTVNLVSNIGFDQRATHTAAASRVSGIPAGTMEFPLTHPPSIVRDTGAERDAYRMGQTPPPRPTLFSRAWRRMRRSLLHTWPSDARPDDESS